MKRLNKTAISLVVGCMGFAASAVWSADSLQDVLKERGLSQQDLLAAAKTYVPTGKRDEFVAFSSGGQSGQARACGSPLALVGQLIVPRVVGRGMGSE